MQTTELRRAANWRELETGTVFMFERDLIGAKTSPEPWRFARMVVELPTSRKAWVSFYTGYTLDIDPESHECNECVVIAEPIG